MYNSSSKVVLVTSRRCLATIRYGMKVNKYFKTKLNWRENKK